jgi:hypothetical protein
MPHDRNNEPLKEGDIVHVPCIIKTISIGNEYCNVALETVEVMYPGQFPTAIHLNSKQVVKVE